MSVTTVQHLIPAPMRNNLIAVQAALIALCAIAAWIYKDYSAALSALFGGAVALANAWLLARRVEHVSELVKTDPNRGMFSMYMGAVQRFVLVIVALALGLGLLRLDPVPMVLTFGIAQLAYAIAAGKQTTYK